MAIFPFIIIKSKADQNNSTLINHEQIHLQQQLELLLIPFYLLYLLNYSWNFLHYRDHDKAYREIIFEREAYQNENDLTYLQRRNFWAWLNF